MSEICYTNPIIEGADPFILLHEGVYYHYATTCDDGYIVSTSVDFVNWTDKGFCLRKEDVAGNQWFWAPEVKYFNGKFYMVYTADRHLGIAVSDSPLGPFKQEVKRFLFDDYAIDGHIFIDDDGKIYLFYVRQYDCNAVYVSLLSDDFTSVVEGSEKFIFTATQEWETHDKSLDWVCNEGPFVLKHKGKYYLTYSANDFRDPYYSIGYAVSDSPLGPYTKYENNPILFKSNEVFGTGHHSFTTTPNKDKLLCVYHCHNSATEVHPRMTCIDLAEFVTKESGEVVLEIHGPTATEQRL